MKNTFFKQEELLRRGTEFLGVDLKYFISGGSWTAYNQFVNGLLSFLLVIVFANLLPKETYGVYTYLLSLAGFFTVFTLSGMNTAVLQAVASGNEGILKSSVKYQIKWNTIMMAVLFGLSGYYFWNNNYTFAVSLMILGVASPLTNALNTYGALLIGKKNFKLDSLFSSFSTLVYSLGMIIAVLVSKEVWWLILVYSLTTLGTNIFFYFKTLRIYNLPETESPETIKYGWKLTFIGFMAPIVGQIDKIILGSFWGPAELAVYFLARAIPDRVYLYIKELVSVGLPKLAERKIEDINAVFYKRIFQGLAIGILIAGVYILISPFLFKYLLPKYLESVRYSQLLSLVFIFAAPARYIGSLFTIKKMVRPVVIANLIANVFKIILYVVLGIWGGIIGLIITELIFQATGLIINIVLWKSEIKLAMA